MTPVYHFDIAQGSAEWLALRADKWTSSNAAVIMGGLETEGLKSLIKDVAWARVYGYDDTANWKSPAMQRGNDLEDEAIERYCFENDVVFERCGFVQHGELPNVAWSPDAISLSRRIGLEIKNPLHRAYMDCMKQQKIPSAYRWQCRWGMWAGGLDGLVFVYNHPKARQIVIPAELTAEDIEQMAERVHLLEKRVDEWIEIIGNEETE